jgi:hypothetical protein
MVIALAVCSSLFNIIRISQFRTLDASITINERGFVTSLQALKTKEEDCPKNHASPLLSLQDHGKLMEPTKASFKRSNHEVELLYPNGARATVKIIAKNRYFRFELLSLNNRGTVDDIVWGPVHTNVSQFIGDIIGVVHDSKWAIGMVGLTDNTIPGPPIDGDCYGMAYFVHSPDPTNIPVKAPFKEGQRFNIGGDGVNDVAFYSHPEEYFQQVFGSGAQLEPKFGSTIAYHSRDRRLAKTHLFSLLPGFKGSRPRHQVSDPVNVDFIGSAVALFACPAEKGLSTIESIQIAEQLPHVMMDGKWVRDPSSQKPDIAWYGPHDKLIEYANALGLKAVQDEGQGEYYANPADHWQGKRVGFATGQNLSYKEFTSQLAQHGIKYGLHTLCLFLQAGRCTDVSPVPSENLQTVLRTKLANPVSETATEITVTDPSFLAEDGTWPMRDGSNTLKIGNELLTYTGISTAAPYTLIGIKRAQFGTSASKHSAGDELSKLQMNCYNGFVPDMEGMLRYADYYATVLAENGMEYIDFDGLESTVYQNHGYFGVRRFFRRLFDSYAAKTGGKTLRVMGSNVFAGGWEYMSVCNIGGDNNMFDPILNHWGIEGKDVRNGFGNSYLPATFGIQSLHSDWSLFDAENLQAKSIGWGATFMLGLSQASVENCGEKDSIFRSFRAWEDARAKGVFTQSIKRQLRDMNLKFHLERTGKHSFQLTPLKEIRTNVSDHSAIRLNNSGPTQPLRFSIRFIESLKAFTATLPSGQKIHWDRKIEPGQFILSDGDHVYLADKNRRKIADIKIDRAPVLPNGSSTLSLGTIIDAVPTQKMEIVVWITSKSTQLS